MRFLRIPLLLALAVALGSALYIRDGQSPTLSRLPLSVSTASASEGVPGAKLAGLSLPPAPPVKKTADLLRDATRAEEPREISRGALERFVALHHHSAESLLAAWTESGDTAWLEEAASNFPDLPAVALAVLAARWRPEERAQWLAAFRAGAPKNPLADYLAADDAFRAGDPESAFEALRTANAKVWFDDYSSARLSAREELYVANVADAREARLRARRGLPMEALPPILSVARELLAIERERLGAGDLKGALFAVQFQTELGRTLADCENTNCVAQTQAGLRIEESALSALAASAAPKSVLSRATDRLAELAKRRTEVGRLSQLLETGNPKFSPEDLDLFIAVSRARGEVAALRWLATREQSESRAPDASSQAIGSL